MTMLLTEEDGLRRLSERLFSKRYWLIFATEPIGLQLMTLFEEQFYPSGKDKAFELMMLHALGGIITIGIAEKRHCSPDAMSDFLNKHNKKLIEATEALLETQDVLSWGPDLEQAGLAVEWVTTRCVELGIPT